LALDISWIVATIPLSFYSGLEEVDGRINSNTLALRLDWRPFAAVHDEQVHSNLLSNVYRNGFEESASLRQHILAREYGAPRKQNQGNKCLVACSGFVAGFVLFLSHDNNTFCVRVCPAWADT
jgi:hypothetical protein